MAVISKDKAIERLARRVEKADSELLPEIYSELHPEEEIPASLNSAKIAEYVRKHVAPEEVVDLWNVLFPIDRNVWYNEETDDIHYNEEVIGAIDD